MKTLKFLAIFCLGALLFTGCEPSGNDNNGGNGGKKSLILVADKSTVYDNGIDAATFTLYYDGLIFHRCIKDFMIQGGDPQGTGFGDPGYSIAGEFTNNGFKNDLKHERGVLSMARSNDPDTAGSQFFIMHQDYPGLDNNYASFGRVLEGLEVVDAIAEQETDDSDKPLTPQVIKKITVETFGVEYPQSEKL